MDYNFIYRGYVDTTVIKALIENDELIGNSRFKREEMKYPHHNTASWFFRHTGSFNDKHAAKVFTHTNWQNAINFFTGLKNHFNNFFENYEIIRAVLVNLPAGKDIPKHLDAGDSLMYAHRCHIPIITNNDVLFTVDNETIVMKQGEIYEINNSKLHSVNNNGNTDRYHLIVDIEENYNGKPT